MRVRKLIGAIALLALVVVYALVLMVVGSRVLMEAQGWPLWLFYIFAGLAWLIPAMPLIRWMQRPDNTDVVAD